jgi:uncharacterized protein (TIGR03435 family)
MVRRACSLTVVILACIGALGAQTPATSRFEVASIRESKPIPLSAGPMLQEGGRLYTINLTLSTLIREAYGLEENQVIGGPSWMDSTGFDVEARAGAGATPAHVRAMLRELLSERFGLATHPEQRQLPIYELTMSGRDGKPGPRMKASGANCQEVTLPTLGPGAPPPPPPPPALAGTYLGADRREPMRCPAMIFTGHVSARLMTMNGFAEVLRYLSGRPVVNRTGLSGAFDLDLTYSPDPDAGFRGGPPPATNAPALFTALREQLGLRLESGRGAVDVLVIDRANPPTAN